MIDVHCAVILSAMLCIATQNLSIGVNVVSKGSPSLILRVLLISLGITIRPRSSTGCTIPVAVPDKIFGLTLILDFIDRCHSLRQSTSYNAPFSASEKFRLYLGFSSPHKAGFAGSPFSSATGSAPLVPLLPS